MRLERRTSWLLAAGVFLALPLHAADKAKPAAKAAPVPAGASAIVDGVAITEEDMAKAAGPKWAQFKAQEYQFKRELIEGAIGQKLLENEAKKRGITVADLRQQEVESKTEAVSETQAKEFYEQNRQRFGTLAEAEAHDQIQKGLFQQRLQR